jgi:diguanylate cyclase (GGDEF)-like protein
VVRQSCGCLPQPLASAPSETARPWCDDLQAALVRSIGENDGGPFRQALADILRRLLGLDREVDALQEVVSHLRDCLAPGQQGPFAEDLLHQARALIGEGAKCRYHRNLFEEKRTSGALEELSTLLFSTLKEDQVLQVFHQHLPSVGIRHAEVIFFETGDNRDGPVARGVIKRPGQDPGEVRFLCKHFPPEGLYPADEPFHLALVPLVAGDEEMGFVAFDAGNLAPCGVISRATAAAVRSARLYARVHELSVTDPLTGLCNRRSLMDLLKKEAERSQRNGLSFAVIMLDIDHFKAFNDTYGHPAGDEALRRVAECLRQGARRSIDVVARYGGEEFLILLPEVDLPGAWAVAEAIRSQVEACRTLPRNVTISLGVHLVEGGDLSVQECIERADQALYLAKESSRNCTRVFGHPGPLTQT